MRTLQIIGAALIFFASPAMAKEAVASWTVAQKSGDVRVTREGMQPASVNLRAALAPGDVVATGTNGRAMLTKGDDYVVLAPDSRLVLPKSQERSGFTRLIQQMGTLLYKVKRTGVPHFEVETPMLAAVVKGTTFTVVVDQKGAAVQVTEGLVEVSSLTGSERRFVSGGLTVYVGRERPNEIVEIRPDAVELPSEAADGDGMVQIPGGDAETLSTIGNLTDGLVREAPAALVLASGKVLTTPSTPSTPLALVSNALTDTGPVADSLETAVAVDNEPVLGGVETTLPGVFQSVLEVVGATVPAIADPVIEIVETTAPAITEPVIAIVETTVPTITEPVIEIVETTVPAIADPVIEIVETTVPTITEPAVEIVETTVPTITEPVVEIVETTVPAITDPVIGIVETTVPAITEPAVDGLGTVPVIICTLLCGR